MRTTTSDDQADADSPPLPLTTIDCPLCQDQRSRPVLATKDYVYGVPGIYRFVQCLSCQHIFINPRPSDDILMECYPEDYAPYCPSGESGDSFSGPSRQRPVVVNGRQSAAGPRGWLRRSLSRVPGLKRFLFWLGQQHATVVPVPHADRESRLLEIGCAHGGYLAEAQAAGWEVDGVEPNEGAAGRARSSGFNVQTGTLSDVEIPDASRQAVVAWMVLEHVPDPREFVSRVYQMLTPGGVFCVSVPNGAGFERRLFGRYWLGYDAPRHLQVFTVRRLSDLLREAGFSDVKVIHQASLRYWWGSLAAWGLDRFPNARWPGRWMRYFVGEPPVWLKWIAMVPEKLLAALHLSRRITVIASKR